LKSADCKLQIGESRLTNRLRVGSRFLNLRFAVYNLQFAILLLAALLFLPVPGQGQAGFREEDYRFLPVRMHLLRSQNAAELNCGLQEADARRILGKINGIWKQAGIQFYAESILSEDAANQELYEGLGENRTEGHLQLIRPRPSRSDRVIHLYYLGRMRPNGIALRRSHELIFVKETARLRMVPGGIDEPLPRVSAHEIGHVLDLDHREDLVNLMASGTTGTSLNEAESETARKSAEQFSWHLKPAQALELADRLAAENRIPSATALYMALAGLPPGDLASAARKHLEELKTIGQ
jgi:hypothetical protein